MPWPNEETIIKEDGKVDEAKAILKEGGWTRYKLRWNYR